MIRREDVEPAFISALLPGLELQPAKKPERKPKVVAYAENFYFLVALWALGLAQVLPLYGGVGRRPWEMGPTPLSSLAGARAKKRHSRNPHDLSPEKLPERHDPTPHDLSTFARQKSL
jgi:hypothetical protein